MQGYNFLCNGIYIRVKIYMRTICTNSVKAKNICLKIEIKINYFDLILDLN